jgi:hypothetical protein
MGDPTVLDDSQRRGFLATLLGVYLSPGESFVALLRRPPVVAAIVGIVALNLAFTAVWMANVEPREFMKAQIEEAGRWDEIPAERREEVLDQQSRVLPFMAWGGAVLGGPILVFLAGGLYLFIFRFFYASEVTFKQSLGIVAIVFLAVGLVTSPVSLLTLALKGDWTLNPQMVLQANLGAAVEREAVPKALYALLESLDLFSFWLLTLLSIGYAVASRRSTGSAFWGVAAPWILYVLGKIAWKALF